MTTRLLVRLGAIGDILHALPAAASLRDSFPGDRLIWAVEPRWAPLLEDNSDLDGVVWIDRGSPGALVRSWQALRAERVDEAIDLQGLWKSALVAWLSGAERIYGPDPGRAREGAAAVLYTHQVSARATHIVDQHLEMVAAVGARASRRFPVPAGEPEGELPERFILASPLAGWAAKQWPPEHYEELDRLLRQAGMAPLVWNVAPGQTVRGKVRVHRSGLRGLIDATRRAEAVVGVDSGPLHLAAALGKPGVAIFGPTDPKRNGPYGGSMRVLRAAGAETSYARGSEIAASMRSIGAGAVWEALRKQG